MMSSIKRFWRYWRENIAAAREGHEMIVLIVFLVWQLLYFALKYWGFDLIGVASHPQWFEAVEPISIVLVVLWGLLWFPFLRHEKEQGEFAKKIKELQEKSGADIAEKESEVKSLSEQLQKRVPNLKCDILKVQYAPSGTRSFADGATKTNDDVMGVALTLRVTNIGWPSTAWNWRLRVVLTSGEPLEAMAQFLPLSLTGAAPMQDPILKEPEKYLPTALSENPLGSGSAKIGWIVFLVKNVGAEIGNPGTRFSLVFDDGEGKKVAADHIIPEPPTTAQNRRPKG